ncbi:MAG: hypothetical protein ACKVQW_03965 [Pyrinomonadaceae bacterium]
MTKKSPFDAMFVYFAGLAISVGYGVFSMVLIRYLDGETEAQEFVTAYNSSFKTIISLGLSIGTALVVFKKQKDIPEMIEAVFTKEQLEDTDYAAQKAHFWSQKSNMLFAAQTVFAAFLIFTYCQFPLTGTGNIMMMIAVCAEYGFASFVGRKLRYTSMMLHSLLDVKVTRNLFKERELDSINWYVNVASTLTMIFVYVHIMFYYAGPFTYGSELGKNVKILIILPAIMATPVLLIFNFYPREVLRKLYSKSIDVEMKNLRQKMANENLNAYEKRSYLIEFNKMSRDELRYSLQHALADLPIGITILALVLQTLLK